MSTEVHFVIPTSTLRLLDVIPRDRPVAMLVRHSVRDPLPIGPGQSQVPITAVGRQLALELGGHIARSLRTVHTSPVIRCEETARAILLGADRLDAPIVDELLGGPGAFVCDHAQAREQWNLHGILPMIAHMAFEPAPRQGMADPDFAARFLVDRVLRAASGNAGIHVFVTHDNLIYVTVARLFSLGARRVILPWFLEAAYFWRDDCGQVICAYKEDVRSCGTWPLVGLHESDVVGFARREIGRVLGLGSMTRFFLAGGAFKSLLSGRPPKDLDLWAPDDRQRAELVRELRAAGATELPPAQFAAVFEHRGRRIEVPVKCDTPTLEQRLARFDLALSAVGVEHLGADSWRAVIHAKASDGVRRHEVRLLQPLVNQRPCLATLVRLHRYAEELGYVVPRAEVDFIWDTYQAAPRELQLGMLQRFDASAHPDPLVRQEAVRRLSRD